MQNIQLLEYPLAFIEMPWVSIRLYNTQYLQETFHLYPIHRPLPYTFTKFHYLWIIERHCFLTINKIKGLNNLPQLDGTN